MKNLFSIFIAILFLAVPLVATAQTVPGPADAGRIRFEDKIAPPQAPIAPPITAPERPLVAAPEGSNKISFVLNSVTVKGNTVFGEDNLRAIYGAYIGKKITLDMVWLFAGAITERYHNAGYFLSEARVPMQAIHGGNVTINVVEGYVGRVKLGEGSGDSGPLLDYVNEITALHPATTQGLESILLRLNDLPGPSYRAVLSAAEKDSNGVTLTLMPQPKPVQAVVSIDNYGSRFLGPHEASILLSASLLPAQQTTVFGLTSLGPRELKYFSLTHAITLAPSFTLELGGGVTKAHPGFTLEFLNIKSDSESLSAKLSYQPIRQRQENLVFSLALDGRETTSYIAGAPLTRDHVRAARLGVSYDTSDPWSGYNSLNVTLSHGLDIISASQPGELYLSRAKARPDFMKFELAYTRTQAMSDNWLAVAAVSGQAANGPLFSSEEFGYGGKSFGRAFDESELTGDHGVSASLEFRYGGWSPFDGASVVPYAFGDIGKIWNDDVGQPAVESAASLGAGVRFTTGARFSGHLGLAIPVFRSEGTPVYGWSSHSPRLLLQIQKEF